MLAIFFSKKNVISKIAGSLPLAGCCPLVAIAMVADKKNKRTGIFIKICSLSAFVVKLPLCWWKWRGGLP